MNLNPDAIKILCYGDSNTWGYIPISEKRYPVGVRWTSLLQEALGSGFWVVEEGLNGRTTDAEDPDSPGKNGLLYLHPCLKTHNPIDIIVLMLGTNDTKQKFGRSPARIAEGLAALMDEIELTAYDRHEKSPQVIIVSPPLVDDSVEKAREDFVGATQRSKGLAPFYEQLAAARGAGFLDLAGIVSPSKRDGIHLEPSDHQRIAQKFAEIITSMNIGKI